MSMCLSVYLDECDVGIPTSHSLLCSRPSAPDGHYACISAKRSLQLHRYVACCLSFVVPHREAVHTRVCVAGTHRGGRHTGWAVCADECG